MAILGAIVGAGFASGKEISTFFGQYGFWSLPFVALTLVLFFWCFYLFSKLGKMIKPKSITDMTKAMFGKAGIFVDLAFILCTFITLASMLAGCDSIGTLAFGSNYNFCYISIATAILATIIVSVGLKYIYRTTNVILPTMLVFICTILIIFLANGNDFNVNSTISGTTFNFFSSGISSILYVCLNIFTNIFIIAKTSEYMNKKQIGLASIIASLILCLFISLILVAMLLGGKDILFADMPMVKIAYSVSKVVGVLYSIVLWLAIFTTISVASFSLVEWLNNFIKNRFVCCAIILTIGFIFSRFGFSTIVDIFYPIDGIFGAVIVIYATIYYFKHKQQYCAEQTAVINDLKIDEAIKQHFICNKTDINKTDIDKNEIKSNAKQHIDSLNNTCEMTNDKTEIDSILVKKDGKKINIKKKSSKNKK